MSRWPSKAQAVAARFAVLVAGLAVLIIVSGTWTVWPDVRLYLAGDSFVGFLGSMVLVFTAFLAPELITSAVGQPAVTVLGVLLAGGIVTLRYRRSRTGSFV